MSLRTARGWSERLAGLVVRRSVLGRQWVELSASGAWETRTPFLRAGVPLWRVEHCEAVALARLWFEGVFPGRWVPEHEFRGVGVGRQGWRRPDGGWWGADDGLWAVEVELSRKTASRLQYRGLMERMHPEVAGVWWLCPAVHVEWLAGRLQGSRLPVKVLELPGWDSASHPHGCVCMLCRVAGLPQEYVHAAVPGIVPRDEMLQAWQPLADGVPRELGGKS